MDPDRRGSEPFVDQSFLLQNPNFGMDVLAKLNEFRSGRSFTDAVLCVGHEEFPCHRNVLAVSSPYFHAMFSSDLRESREAKICMNEVSPWTLRRLIDYAYTGRIEITVENAQDLLAASSLFQYPDIVDGCCEFLARHLHPSNCLGIEDFAHLHSCSKLETDAHQYTLDNFSAVVEFEEFLELPLSRVISYLASDLIDVRTEESVFEAAVKWIQNDIDHHRDHVVIIMQHIRFATIDIQYLEEVIVKHPLIRTSEKCLAMIADARQFHETRMPGQRRRSMQTDTYTPRPSTVAKEVFVVLGGVNNMNYIMQSVEMYDPYKDKWTSLPDMPQPTSWCSASAVGNAIYVTGGIVDGNIVATVWCFESTKRVWSEVAPMRSPRARHTSAVLDGRLYVLGGICLSGIKVVAIETIECYNMAADQWLEVGHSPFPRKQSTVVPYNQTLVEVGGTQNGAQVQTMESYICNNNSVTYSGEQFILPECIQFSQILLLNDVFYIIWEDTKKMISLSPKKRSFRRLPDMNYKHIHGGAAVLGSRIFVAGGLVDSTPSRIVECYDVATETWTAVKTMRQARACHAMVSLQMS